MCYRSDVDGCRCRVPGCFFRANRRWFTDERHRDGSVLSEKLCFELQEIGDLKRTGSMNIIGHCGKRLGI